MRFFRGFLSLSPLAAVSLCLAAQQVTPPKPPPGPAAMVRPGDGYTFDFQDADIRAVLTALGTAGGIRYMYSDLPSKKVSLHIDRPVRAVEIPDIMRSIAQTNGLRFNNDSGFITISTASGVANAPGQTPLANTNLYVYRLRHANATQLSSVLQAVFATSGGGARPATPTVQNGRLSASGGSTGTFGGLSGSGVSGGLGGFGGGAGGGGVAIGGAGAGGGGFGAFGGAANRGNLQNFAQALISASGTPIVIVPEQTTNSLLVRASPDDWSLIQQTIQSVDLRPLQVVIEVLIAEVSRNDDLKYGVSGTASKKSGNNVTTGTLAPPADSSSNLILNLAHNGAININVALSALKTRGDVRILSLPLVFAQNNQESTLLVGSEQPFVESYTTSLVNTEAQNQVVQYRNVGTLLDIIPTINQDGYVNLQVYQEVSSVTNTILFQAPVINTRQAQAAVFVKDGQTIVVGGLTDREKQDTKQGIPILSSIPLIGGLFGTTEHTTTRTEIYLFLTPHIVASDSDADHIREQIGDHSALLHDIPSDSLRVIDVTPPQAVVPPAPAGKP